MDYRYAIGRFNKNINTNTRQRNVNNYLNMLQTWLLAVSIVAGGVIIFALDWYIRRFERTPISHLVFFLMVGGAYYAEVEGLVGAVVLGVVINGVHAFVARKQSVVSTVP